MATEDDVAQWVCEQVSALGAQDRSMGGLEKLVERVTREARRKALERLVRESAASEVFGCPKCGRMLRVVDHRRRREVQSLFGKITFRRSYGLCPSCQCHWFPADAALGLHERASLSPRLQEICAVMTLRAPAGQAEEDVRRLSGVSITASTMHREARRQGERALEIRKKDERLADTPAGAEALAARAPRLPPHSTLVIEIDAWNIRERDRWGDTEWLRLNNEALERWHWVYTGTVFRLDQRYAKDDRPVIAGRGYVATRSGLASFKNQIYAEALQRGLRQAETVLVLGDGAVWIWNLAEEKFSGARQRLDLFHVKEHLWTLAGELYGKGTPEAHEWVRPYLRWLEQRQDGVLDVINSLDELQQMIGAFNENQRKAIAGELAYMNGHKRRMDYKDAQKSGQPCGSGAIESTCSQYQRRFKMTGQFWSVEGDEELLALATLHRNRRWHCLFPHDHDA